jgi:hypothetical protein
VGYGSRALPFFGHSPVVAVTSKRVGLSRSKSEACLDKSGSGKILMRRGRAANVSGQRWVTRYGPRLVLLPHQLVVLVVDELVVAVTVQLPTGDGPMRTDTAAAQNAQRRVRPAQAMNPSSRPALPCPELAAGAPGGPKV